MLRKEEMLLKQMLSGAVTKRQMENKLKFYKFSGTVILLKEYDTSDSKQTLVGSEEVTFFLFRKFLV